MNVYLQCENMYETPCIVILAHCLLSNVKITSSRCFTLRFNLEMRKKTLCDNVLDEKNGENGQMENCFIITLLSTARRGLVTFATGPPVDDSLTMRRPDSCYADRNVVVLLIRASGARNVIPAFSFLLRVGFPVDLIFSPNNKTWKKTRYANAR